MHQLRQLKGTEVHDNVVTVEMIDAADAVEIDEEVDDHDAADEETDHDQNSIKRS
tara:strand:+ start:143 stop:307 length:165 start_codon:yes stop_codon:yes gene_type:complete